MRHAAPAADNFFFWCVSVFLQTFFFYLHTIYFSIYSLSKQFISKLFTMFQRPPPPPRSRRQKNSGSIPYKLCDFSGRIMRGFTIACFEPNLQNVRQPAFPKKQK